MVKYSLAALVLAFALSGQQQTTAFQSLSQKKTAFTRKVSAGCQALAGVCFSLSVFGCSFSLLFSHDHDDLLPVSIPFSDVS
jgi:hypothetical protein